MFLGDQLPAWLLLAFGAALAVGTALALLRPRETDDGEVVRPPLGRSLVMIAVGSVCAIWAAVSLVRAG
jgi:hypothetical protein